MKLINLFALIVLNIYSLFGQNISFEYGKISDFEKNYTDVDFEPGAPAIIFFNKKEISYETGQNGYVKFIKLSFRAKVLKAEGKYYADRFKIPFIKGYEFDEFNFHTINYENGEQKISELKEDEFFEEKVIGNLYNKVGALKNVKVGTIIEYSIKIHSTKHWYISDWHFQKSVPVIHSELTAKIPSFYYFRTFFQNCDTVNFSETTEYSQYMDLRYFGLSTAEGAVKVKGLKYNFIKNDIPSFKSEPYIASNNEYKQKIVFQLTATHYPGKDIKHYMTSWKNLHKEILEHDNIYKQIKKNKLYTQIIESTVSDSMPHEEKIEKLYNYVRDNISWNEKHSAFTQNNLTDILKQDKPACTAEINLILINLLQHADINAYPVFISTRFNGKPYKSIPIADQFNSLIVFCEYNNSTHLLDAHQQLPYNILPQQDLNYEGWLVREDSAYWIPIKDKNPSLLQGMVNIKFNDSESYTINTELLANNQTCIDLLKGKNADQISTIQIPEIIINSDIAQNDFSITSNTQSSVKLTNSYTAETLRKPDIVYFEPGVINLANTKLNKQIDRKFPIDFIYNDNKYIVYNIEIPEGYTVKELPKSMKISLLRNAGNFFFSAMKSNSSIRLIYRIQMNETLFSNEDFTAIKEFNEMILQKQNTILVFQKNN